MDDTWVHLSKQEEIEKEKRILDKKFQPEAHRCRSYSKVRGKQKINRSITLTKKREKTEYFSDKYSLILLLDIPEPLCIC